VCFLITGESSSSSSFFSKGLFSIFLIDSRFSLGSWSSSRYGSNATFFAPVDLRAITSYSSSGLDSNAEVLNFAAVDLLFVFSSVGLSSSLGSKAEAIFDFLLILLGLESPWSCILAAKFCSKILKTFFSVID